MQTHTTVRRRNRVYKSLHLPFTYLGVEQTLFSRTGTRYQWGMWLRA
jgi:hypothetical protein